MSIKTSRVFSLNRRLLTSCLYKKYSTIVHFNNICLGGYYADRVLEADNGRYTSLKSFAVSEYTEVFQKLRVRITFPCPVIQEFCRSGDLLSEYADTVSLCPVPH
jgi:hypothetical protein